MIKILLEVCRYTLIALFFYTGMHKVIDFETFYGTLVQSRLLSRYTDVFAFLLPLVELIAIILLWIDKLFLKGLYFSLILLVSFTLYLIVLNNFSLIDGCSCGGIFNRMDYTWHLITNVFFVFLNITAIFLYDGVNKKK